MEPLVSIVIPTYNRSGVISQTIDSVLHQTYPRWELLIIDDGSTDNTSALVAAYNDPRIHYFPMEHSGVIGKVRNHGMKMAAGEFIAFLDSDDLWSRGKLECQLSLFKKFPEADFVFSNGNEFGELAITPPDQEDIFAGNVFLPIILEHRFSLFVSSWVVRRSVFETTGWIDESMRSGGDVDFFLTMAYSYQGVFTNQRLVNHRKHQQGISVDLEVVAYEEHCQTLEKFLGNHWLTRRQHAAVAGDLFYKKGLLLLKRKRPKEAARSFADFILMRPLYYKGWIRFAQATFRAIAHQDS
jgi:glycosyltransferase involved in cell wall biosynthesis